MSDIILSFYSLFTAEYWVIIQGQCFIQNFSEENNLIISDSQSALYAITSNLFKLLISPLCLLIRSRSTDLIASNRFIRLLWNPSHVGIVGNETINQMASDIDKIVGFPILLV